MANSHLKALLKKNWILWKRNCCCSVCEIILPILLSFAIVAIRAATSKSTVPNTNYII